MSKNTATITRETKAFPFQIKDFDDEKGIIKGYLSTFDNVDEGNDRVRPGAFKRTLANKYEYKNKNSMKYLMPLLWQHDPNTPIGGYTDAKEDNIGLFVTLELDLDVQKGKEAYSALKKGYVFQQSMGYDTLQSNNTKVDGRWVRDLIEVRLWEGSLVTFPMNTEAVVTNVKSTPDGLASELKHSSEDDDNNDTSNGDKLSPEELDKIIEAALESGNEPAKITPAQMPKFTWQVGDLVPSDGEDEEDEEDDDNNDSSKNRKHGNHDQSTHGRRRSFSANSPFDGSNETALHQKLINDSAKPWVGSLSKDEIEAVGRYTGIAYVDMNSSLRSGEKIPEGLRQTVLDTQSALLQSKVPENMTLTRYMSPDMLEHMSEGKYFVDHGFMSTSISGTASSNFGELKMTIQAYKGAPGGYVQPISSMPGEKEFLLPPNAQLKIKSITKDSNGVTHVLAEYKGKSKAMGNPAIDSNGTPTWKKSKKWLINSSMQTKTITGNTALPIGPRDESWDGTEAEKQIFTYATKDDETFDVSKLKQCFMVQDGDAQQKTSWSYPFCFVINDKPRICVGAVIAIAEAIGGARNASPPDGIKNKVKTLYNRINKLYPDDPQLKPSWEDDNDKSSGRHMNRKSKEKKTVQEHYAEEMCQDLLEDWQDVFICALTCSILDAFKIGDQPEADISTALDDFKELVLTKFVPEAVECDLSGYLTDNSYSLADYTMQNGSSSPYGYMSSNRALSSKAGRAVSAATQQKIADHVENIKSMAKSAKATMQGHVDDMHKAASAMVDDLTGSGGKSLNIHGKAGRAVSAATAQALQGHADNIGDMADKALNIMQEHTKSIRSAADDFANTMQGSETPYTGDDPGEPDDDQQEGKSRNAIPPLAHSESTHSLKRTADEEKAIADAIDDLRKVGSLI